MKKLNWDKELKKVQKRGLYNPKVRVFSIIAIAILTLGIGLTFSAFSYSSGDVQAFNSQVKKKVTVTVNVTNGTTDSNYKVGDYNKALTITITPNNGYVYGSVSCTNNQSATYDSENKVLNITPTKDTSCSISFNETFSHKIIANNTLITLTPDFTKGEPPASGSNTGSGLYATIDDDGTSYYFRGDVKNNYVSFANRLWRIIRINGDGTIRIITDEKVGTSVFNSYYTNYKYAGYTYDNASSCTKTSPCISTYNASTGQFTNNKNVTNSTIKGYLEEWYNNNLKEVDDKISMTTYCNDTMYYVNSNKRYYASSERIEIGKPSLKCLDTSDLTIEHNQAGDYGGIYKQKIGLITADEMNFAGISYNSPYASSSNYLYDTSHWWSMSPTTSNGSGIVEAVNGQYYIYYVDHDHAVLPVINLNFDVTSHQGNGTENSPYIID